MRSNYIINRTPQFKLLSEDQLKEIHLATLSVLEQTGVEVLEDESLELLKNAGADISGTRVCIPQHLVEEAIQSAPQKVTLWTRDGKKPMILEDHRTYYGTGSDCPNIIDPYTGERRKFTKQDIANAMKICDYLPNIDFVMSMGFISDVPPEVYDKHQFATMILNTVKPIIFTANDKSGLADIIEIAKIVVGSEEELVRKPILGLYAEPISPLRHPKTSLEKLLLAAEKRIPVVYTPAPMSGATAPVTLAGTLVSGNAELLSGLVIHQLKQKGAPFIYGGVFTIMDMATTIFSYAAPEFHLLHTAHTELAHYYKLPVFSTAGCSDSKTLDQQAGIEAGLSCLMTSLCGANLVHDVGYIEYGLTSSYEMLVMSDEIISMVKRIMRSIEINEDTLAVDLIGRIGPGGHFLTDDHTLKYFKKEHWRPNLFDRTKYEVWKTDGKKTLGDKLNTKVKQILETHTPEPVEKDLQEKISKIINK